MSQPIVVVEGVSKYYLTPRARRKIKRLNMKSMLGFFGIESGESKAPRETIAAVHDVSFKIECGIVCGIIGANGAGKTTLLKIIAGITMPSEGVVTGFGRVISLLELGTGFQPELSGRKNVYLNAAIYGVPKEEVDQLLPSIIEFAELQDRMDLPLKHFSSGMYVRLAMAVAINLEPDILLADEVLSVGDGVFRQKCLFKLRKMVDDGLTVIFVSHDLEMIDSFCSNTIWMHSGSLIMNDQTPEVVAAYRRYISTGNLPTSDTIMNKTVHTKETLFDEITIFSSELHDSEMNIVDSLEVGESGRLRIGLQGIAVKSCLQGSLKLYAQKKNKILLLAKDFSINMNNSGKCFLCFNIPNYLGQGLYYFDLSIYVDGKIDDRIYHAAVKTFQVYSALCKEQDNSVLKHGTLGVVTSPQEVYVEID